MTVLYSGGTKVEAPPPRQPSLIEARGLLQNHRRVRQFVVIATARRVMPRQMRTDGLDAGSDTLFEPTCPQSRFNLLANRLPASSAHVRVNAAISDDLNIVIGQ